MQDDYDAVRRHKSYDQSVFSIFHNSSPTVPVRFMYSHGVEKILIYQRNKNRKLTNAQETLNTLRTQLNRPQTNVKWDLELMHHNEQRPPCELVLIL